MIPILSPKSIAVVGASKEPNKIGAIILNNLYSFNGNVYPVNPKYDEIKGLKCYPTVDAIKKVIDIAIIAVPAHIVPRVMEQASSARSVIIISSEFSEVGNTELADKVLSIAKKNKQRILGPNCIGLQLPWLNINATFLDKLAKPGKIAFISQSGGFCSSLLEQSLREEVGFSAFVSVGNMLDLAFADFVEYFNKDKHTSAIVLYVEGLKDGRKFLSVAKKSKKPIVVLKVGKTEEGVKAAATHTGSLAGSSDIYKGAFKQARIIEAENSLELFDLLKGLSLIKKPKNKKVIIITNSGGPGTEAVDNLEGWELIKLIDLGGGAVAKTYKKELKKLKHEKASFIILVVPTALVKPASVAPIISEIAKKKTVVASFLGSDFRSKELACYDTPARAVNVLKRLY